MIPSTLIVPILLISLSVSESCGFISTMWDYTHVTWYIWTNQQLAFSLTFWPRNRLFADRMVNPSPGPSSTVEFGTDSLSLSVFFTTWREKQTIKLLLHHHRIKSIKRKYEPWLEIMLSKFKTVGICNETSYSHKLSIFQWKPRWRVVRVSAHFLSSNLMTFKTFKKKVFQVCIQHRKVSHVTYYN